MRWFTFAIFVLVFYVLQVGLRSLWRMPIGPYDDAAPNLLLILCVYVSMNAPRHTVLWAMAALGVLTDLQPVSVNTQNLVVIIGPAALGFMLGGLAALQLRALTFRDKITTVMALTFVVGLFFQLVVVALLTTRGLPLLPSESVEGWATADQMLQRLASLIYTVVFAIPVGWLLIRSRIFWRFESAKGATSGGRPR